MEKFRVFILIIAVLIMAGCAASDANRKEEADIHYKLGVAHLNDGNIPESLKELTTAVEKYHGNATFHNALGLAYFAKGIHEDAIKHLKEAIKIDPKFSDAHTNLSAVYLEKKEWDATISESRLALSNIFYTTPEFAYFNMGRAFYAKADYVKAEEAFKKAIESNQRYMVAYNNLGLILIKVKDKKGALNAFHEVIRLAPDSEMARSAKGYLELLK